MGSSAAWRTLSNYESQDLIRARYRERFNRTLSAGAARECRSSITQARSYFESARDADRVVKPLLLYYGSQSLARALVLFLTGRREASLASSHGLSTGDWRSILSGTPLDVGLLSVSILERGSFAEFVSATRNRSLLTYNSSRPNIAYCHGDVSLSSQFTLGDALSRIPELGEFFVRWKGMPNFLPVELKAESACNNAYFNKALHGIAIDKAHIEGFLRPSSYEPILQSEEPRIWYKIGRSFGQMPQLWDHREQVFGTIGDLVAIKEFDLSKPATVYAVSYMMGMLVRYFPTFWMSLIRNEANDASLPTLLAAIDFVEGSFPQLILEFFEQDRIAVTDEVTRG